MAGKNKNNYIPKGNTLARSPEKPQLDPRDDMLLNYMKEKFDTLANTTCSIDSKLDNLTTRISVIEKEIADVKEEQRQTSDKQAAIHTEQQNILRTQTQQSSDLLTIQHDIVNMKASYSDLKEKADRMRRAVNIVVHGLKEDKNATETLDKLISIILPDEKAHVRVSRIGIVAKNKVRPARLNLGSESAVHNAISKCNLLKDQTDFSGIYVTRDLTPQQQVDSKKRREEYKNELLKQGQDKGEELNKNKSNNKRTADQMNGDGDSDENEPNAKNSRRGGSPDIIEPMNE